MSTDIISPIYHGIDISHWNSILNFDKVANDPGVDFIILKAGGSDKGFYRDPVFERNYIAFHHERDIPCGCYYYVGRMCIDKESGRRDAHHLLEIIAGLTFEYPIYIDLESTSPKHKTGATEATIAFCETIEAAGYYAGIYASDVSGFQDRLHLNHLDQFDKWVARYGSRPKTVKKYGMWQSSSSGRIEGINGKVDIDEAYIDYPKLMKKAHLNGY